MTPQDAVTHEIVTFADLKPLAVANGPCLTAVAALNTPTGVETAIKNTVRGLEKKLAERAIDRKAVDDLLAPIRDFAAEVEAEHLWAHAVILFRSPSVFRYYLLHGQFENAQTAADRFQVRPLLQTLAHETRFYLLALSRHQVRLLLCTQHHAEPVDPGADMPRNLDEWMNNRQPDHVLENRSYAGPSTGGLKGVVSGSNSDRDRTELYLTHFFKEIDKAVTARLRGETVPLVLAGVEREIAIYRRVNSYHPTLEKAAIGSPDASPGDELHERAMEVVMSTFTEPLQKAMAQIRELAGTRHASTDPRSIVQAAFQGRVLDLLIAANAEFWGAWNEETQDVDTANAREELLNAACLETVRHGGRAYVLKEADMPVQAPAAAMFRF